MADVVSTSLAVSTGDARLVRRGDDWLLDTGRATFPLAAPHPRRPVAAAPASGADTATVLRGLGIGLP
jgi:hypothetical protein